VGIPLSIAIITTDNSLLNKLKTLIRKSLPSVNVSYFDSENAFFTGNQKEKSDVVLSDQRNLLSGWKPFLDELKEQEIDTFIVFLVDECSGGKIVEMMKEGAYDILTPVTLNRILIVLQRIPEEKEERARLRFLANEKTFGDHIANNSRSMLSIINKEYVYEKVNATFCTAHTINTDAIVGKSLYEIWGRETFESKIKQNIDLCFQGNIVRYEANFNTPLFGNRFFEVVFRPIKKGDGPVTHLLAETFDITELKHSQKIVNDMEEEFKRLETNLPIGFLRCDTNGIIIHANRAFLKIMECEEETLIAGLGIQDFYVEKGLFEIHRSQLLFSAVKTFGRVALYTCIGNEIACRVSAFIVSNESGNPSFIDFAFEDSSRELMLENRLLQAQKLETIGALAGGLAHDFNNVMATISGYSELLMEELPPSSPLLESVTRIRSAVEKAKSITDQILTFSRQVDQEKIPVSIDTVLNETIGFVRSGLKENITIDSEIFNPGLLINADPTQLFRVFLNLFSNAVQAIGDNTGAISVKLFVVNASVARYDLNKDIVADEYIVVSIEDTGEGMEESVMERIFEPYYTTRETGKGTGLGLSVVHGIIAELDGAILVTSKKNVGSKFTVYLPVLSGMDLNTGNIGKGRKLLFITGNRYESKILSLALENSGYKIIYVSDLNGFIKTLSNHDDHPDLVIYMEDSEEISHADLINIYSAIKIEIPIILISDRNQLQAAEKIVNLGYVKQRLTKPVSLKEIHNAIQLSLT
jgi:signal transduction histidine kinase/FixJ family two-component response regulator